MKYSIESYLELDKETGLYDFLSNPTFISQLKKLDYKSTVTVTNRELDELALDVYETEDLWWVLAIYNDVINPYDFSNNLLYAPSKVDLEKLFLEYQEL